MYVYEGNKNDFMNEHDPVSPSIQSLPKTNFFRINIILISLSKAQFHSSPNAKQMLYN